jgi:hypothetical protein
LLISGICGKGLRDHCKNLHEKRRETKKRKRKENHKDICFHILAEWEGERGVVKKKGKSEKMKNNERGIGR